MKRFLIFSLLILGLIAYGVVKLHAMALEQIEAYLNQNTSYKISYKEPTLKISLGEFLFEVTNLRGVSRATGNIEWKAERLLARFQFSDIRLTSIIVNPVEIFDPVVVIPTKDALAFEAKREPLGYILNSFLWQSEGEQQFFKVNRSFIHVEVIRVYNAKLMFLNVDKKQPISDMRLGLLARYQKGSKQWALDGQVRAVEDWFWGSLLFSGTWDLESRYVELFLKTQELLADLKLKLFNPLTSLSFDVEGKVRSLPIEKFNNFFQQDDEEPLFAPAGMMTLSFEGGGRGSSFLVEGSSNLILKGAVDFRNGIWQKENLLAEILKGYLSIDSLRKWSEMAQNPSLEPFKGWMWEKGAAFDFLQSRFQFSQGHLGLLDLRLKTEHYFLEGEATVNVSEREGALQGRAVYMPEVSAFLISEYPELSQFQKVSSGRMVIPYTYRGDFFDNASIRTVIPEDQLKPQTDINLTELENTQEPDDSDFMSVDDVADELKGV